MGDIHLSDRAPSSCTDSYQEDIFDILEEIGRIASERGSDGIIWAGDIFHHKTPGRTSHKTIIDLIDIVNTFTCPVWVVPGNHDMLHDRLDSIAHTQPLGVVLASGAVRILNGWMGIDRFEPVYGVPWLQHFTDDTVTAALATYRAHPADRPLLVVTHAPLYPPGQELVHEFYPAENWAEAMAHHGCVYYGHVHEPHRWYRTAGVTFCNAGAISRGSLHEHNLTREVQIAAWNSQTGIFDLITVPHKPASEVFRLVEAKETRTAKAELTQFLESIGAASIAITSVEAVMTHVRTLGLSPDVERTILTLLEEAT